MDITALQSSIMFFEQNLWIIIPTLICILILKGISLWKTAQAGQKRWFIAILVINTFGILEMVYLAFFATKNPEEKLLNLHIGKKQIKNFS